MASKLFVGGFPYQISPDELAKVFSACGKVESVKLIMDRETGRPKGFGFVEMSTEAEAKDAIAKLNGSMVGERKIFVVEGRAEEKRERGPRPAPGASASKYGPLPGQIERRSGKDRRGTGVPSAPAPTVRETAPGKFKKWEKRPWEKGFDAAGEKKPWDQKPGGFKKKWGDKKPGGFEKKPWDDKKPGGFKKKTWGDRKPWDKKGEDNAPSGVEGGKKWEKKPVQFPGLKKRWTPRP